MCHFVMLSTFIILHNIFTRVANLLNTNTMASSSSPATAVSSSWTLAHREGTIDSLYRKQVELSHGIDELRDNSLKAMKPSGGVITERYAMMESSGSDGTSRVEMIFADNGIGMTLSRLMESVQINSQREELRSNRNGTSILGMGVWVAHRVAHAPRGWPGASRVARATRPEMVAPRGPMHATHARTDPWTHGHGRSHDAAGSAQPWLGVRARAGSARAGWTTRSPRRCARASRRRSRGRQRGGSGNT